MNTRGKVKLTAMGRAEMIRRIVDLHQLVATDFEISERCAYTLSAYFRAEGLAGLRDSS